MSEEIFKPTPHPVLKLPTREQAMAMGPEKLREVLMQREEIIRLEKDDPFRHGFYLDTWKDADAELESSLLLALFGGNGSAKTFYMCRKGIQTMIEKPSSKVLWLHEAEKPSIILHHATVHHYLPKELKVPQSRRSRVQKISYTVANGFSDGKFVLPNGSIGVFGAYKQDIKDYEGPGWTLVCADENMPLDWLKTLLYRLPRCNGKMLWGFTPIRGITPAIKHVVTGAVTTESRRAELLDQSQVHVEDCPAGHMPYKQRAIWPDTNIMYFFSEFNPFGNYAGMKKVLHGRTKTEIEQRAYGYARHTIGSALPKFSAVHIVKQEKMAKILQGKGTRRHYMDPAGARNFFQIWTFTDEHQRRFVYREWPDVPHYGEWAETSGNANKWDGDPGPAQPSLGYGVKEYKRMILENEGWTWTKTGWLKKSPDDTREAEEIFERRIDPRSGQTGTITEEEGGVSLIDMMMDEQVDEQTDLVIGPSLLFEQAPGISEDQGIMVINDLLDWDQEEPLCELLNEPRLFISEDCQNLIWAMQTYTRHDGEKAACKDPIDCLRYFATDDADYIDPEKMGTRGGGSY